MRKKRNEPSLLDLAQGIDSQRSNLSELLSQFEREPSEGDKGKLRKPIPHRLQKRLIVRTRGHCENCRVDLLNVKYEFHHKNGDCSDNQGK